MFRKPKIKRQDAELDITSFMNLMIVLVPVLLMMMVFSHITVLELQLPGLTKLAEQTELLAADDEIEVVVRKQGIKVFYPQGKLINDIARIGDTGFTHVNIAYVERRFGHQDFGQVPS
jgi:biopolymer transport protein ExbD